jgi:deoxyribose-phosphate aldolase
VRELIDGVQARIERLVGRVEFDRRPFQPVPSERLNAVIDHTLLRPEATPEQLAQLCREAVEYRFASVCINPIYIPRAVWELEGSGIPVCTVVGFPLGASATAAKVSETRQALADSAREIDMVLPIGLLIAGEWQAVRDDIRAVVSACGDAAAVKVILENCLLSDEEKIAGCLLAVAAGAAYVKTSTGFSRGGATLDDVRLMRAVVGAGVGVKAAGGIRTHADAEAMLLAGATRLGCSSSVAIMREAGAGR